MIGRRVVIHSTAGMLYSGTVLSIRPDAELGELFELGSDDDPGYRRLVYVADRQAQIGDLDYGR
jgi:hypothetical protein